MINFEDVLSKEMQWSALEILESPAKIKSVV